MMSQFHFSFLILYHIAAEQTGDWSGYAVAPPLAAGIY
jgi:hypothetical protein